MSGVAGTRLYTAQVSELFYWVNSVTSGPVDQLLLTLLWYEVDSCAVKKLLTLSRWLLCLEQLVNLCVCICVQLPDTPNLNILVSLYHLFILPAILKYCFCCCCYD